MPKTTDPMFEGVAEAIQAVLPEGEQLRCVVMVVVTTEQSLSFSEAFDANKQQALQMLGSIRLIDAEITDSLRPGNVVFDIDEDKL